MRFLMTYEGDDNGPPNPEKLEELGKFSAEMQKSGVLVDTGAMLPVATRLTLASGKFSVTDGPFPETKELIVGYAIVEVKSKAEAVELARRFMHVAGDGTGEVRQLAGPNDVPPH